MHPSTLGLLALLPALAAQSPTPQPRVVPYPIDLPAAFSAAVEAGTRTLHGRPGDKHWTNYARYKLAAELDPAASRLTGKATMTYVNRSPHEIGQLVVHAYQDLMKPEAMRTRTVAPTNGLEIQEARRNGKKIRVRARDTRIVVPLDPPLAAGQETTLEIDYAFDVPKAGTAPRMGHEGDKVFYLGYWYPQFAVYDDVDGWVADPHRGNGEFYMGYADYDLELTVPVGYLVRATGELVNPAEVLTEKARAALAQAGKQREVVHVITKDDIEQKQVTAESATGKLVWKFHAENVRDAAVSIARTYLWDATHAVVKDKLGAGKDGTCEIHAVYEPNSGDWVRAAEYARHTIEFMSARVHPYPWPHMTACEGIIGGGMEYPMMTICGGRQPADVIAHELIHMWFPMLVGNNEKRYAWQDEGFTSFWTTLCRDDFTGKKNGPRRDVMMAAAQVRDGGDTVCMRHADTYGDDDFGYASYTKPAAVLHQLRALLGDDVFFAAFRRYTADWAWKHPTPYDFFRSFADVAGQDLEPYFRTWMFEAWTLDHAIAEVAAKDGKTVVTVADRGRAVHPCVVEATFADGQKLRQTIPATTFQQGTQAVVTFEGAATMVVLDPDVATIDARRDNGTWKKP
ncbi:MAG: M1 family metallopeptidase [Planctomycetes bacterium]|nr:M1 family metallopeptidase [Planctomycetota bacterium]